MYHHLTPIFICLQGICWGRFAISWYQQILLPVKTPTLARHGFYRRLATNITSPAVILIYIIWYNDMENMLKWGSSFFCGSYLQNWFEQQKILAQEKQAFKPCTHTCVHTYKCLCAPSLLDSCCQVVYVIIAWFDQRDW